MSNWCHYNVIMIWWMSIWYQSYIMLPLCAHWECFPAAVYSRQTTRLVITGFWRSPNVLTFCCRLYRWTVSLQHESSRVFRLLGWLNPLPHHILSHLKRLSPELDPMCVFTSKALVKKAASVRFFSHMYLFMFLEVTYHCKVLQSWGLIILLWTSYQPMDQGWN